MKTLRVLAISCLLATSCGLASADSLAGWSHGADGYNEIVKAAFNSGEPVILYFHTDWCRYCKQLDSEYLSNSAVSGALASFRKVEINPESGAPEKQLGAQYGVTGYPTLLALIPAAGKTTRRFAPDFDSSLPDTTGFVKEMKETISGLYTEAAIKMDGEGNPEGALKCFQLAAKYSPQSADAYCNVGLAFERLARIKKDMALVQKAKESYTRALELDPQHRNSQDRLAQIDAGLQAVGQEGTRAASGQAQQVPIELKGTGAACPHAEAAKGAKAAKPAAPRKSSMTGGKSVAAPQKTTVKESVDENGVLTLKNH